MLVPALVALALLYAALDSDSGIRPWLRLRGDLGQSRAHIAQLRDEIDALRSDSVALDAEGFAIERAIREDLDFARSGETVVRLTGSKGLNPRFP